jgi:hypothetical protein
MSDASSSSIRSSSLVAELFREVRPGFFRVLSGVNAPVYVDLLDSVEVEAAQRNEGMDREEALAIVTEVLGRHPDFAPEAEGGNEIEPVILQGLPLREKARYVLDYFVRAGWLDAETGADWHRVVFFNPHGRPCWAQSGRSPGPTRRCSRTS